jgi:glutaconyl-CoA/methylmalonyl-CoA decarboxylase subunit gamma
MKLKITLEGKAYEVDVEILEDETGSAPVSAPRVAAPVAAATAPAPVAAPVAAAPASAGGNVYPAPIAGTVFKIIAKPGDQVEVNQVVMVLEAMKMETDISAPAAGKVKAILVNVGDAVQAGHGLVEFE